MALPLALPFLGELLGSIGLTTSFFSFETLGAILARLTFGSEITLASITSAIGEAVAVEGVQEALIGSSLVGFTAAADAIEQVVNNSIINNTELISTAATTATATAATEATETAIVGQGIAAAELTAASGLAALTAAGITEAEVGTVTWNYILTQIATGVAIESVVKTINEDPIGFFNDVVNSIIQDQDGQGSLNELIVIAPDGTVRKFNDGYAYADPYQIGYQSGKLAATAAMSQYERNKSPFDISQKDILFNMLQSYTQNPSARKIAQKLTEFYESIEFVNDLTLFNQVKAVYTGIPTSTPFFDENGNVAIYDEVGQLEVYDGARGITNIGGFELRNPTMLPGVYNWMGPLSPNDQLPADTLDLYSFQHDVNYDNLGFFSIFADFKYVARIENQFERNSSFDNESPNPLVVSYANFAKNWFKYVSPWLSRLVDQSYSFAEAEEFLNTEDQDFYSYVMSDYSFPDEKIYNFGVIRAKRLVIQQGRLHFYAGLKQGIDDSFAFYKERYTSPEILKQLTIYP